MNKLICLMLVVCLVFALTACGGTESNGIPVPTAAPDVTETHVPSKEASLWPRTGYFTDRESSMLSIAWLDDVDEPGWYVGCLLGNDQTENAWSGMLSLKGNSLCGTLPSFGEKEELTITITEEGTDGLLLTVEGVILTPQILRWMHTDPKILPHSIDYLRYYFLGSLALVMYNMLKGVMNAVGDSRRPLYYLIFSSVLNILLDWLFVGPLGKDIRWAAIATMISQFASAMLCLLQLSKKGTVYALSWRKLRIDGKLLKEILRFGIPTGIQNSVIGLANVMVQSNINTFGDVATAACGAYSRIEGFAFLPITSFSMALTTYIGQNLGAREYDRARKGARFGILTAVAMAELIGVIVMIFARPFISAFVENPASIEIGVTQARTESLFFCLLSFSHCIAGICRGAGKAFVPMAIMLAVWCVLRIAYITVAMKISHNIVLLFWAYPITWSVSSLIYLIYYLKSDWIHGFETREERVARLARSET